MSGELAAAYPLLFVPVVLIVLAVHEAGHLIAAKACGVHVLEYGIGLPPRIARVQTGRTRIAITELTRYAVNGVPQPHRTTLRVGDRVTVVAGSNGPEKLEARVVMTGSDKGPFARQRKNHLTGPHGNSASVHSGKIREVSDESIAVADMTWSIGIIPIGAYVRVVEDPEGRHQGSLQAKTMRRRTLIIAAGVIANMIFPVVPIGAATVTAEWEHNARLTRISETIEGTPAHEAGLRAGDVIVAINEVGKPTPQQIRQQVTKAQGEPVRLEVANRGGDRMTVHVKPATDGTIGIRMAEQRQGGRLGYAGTAGRAGMNTLALYGTVAEEIGGWVTGVKKPELASAIGAAQDTGDLVQEARVTGFLIAVAVFSINIGLVNILPIVPLDGGRLAMMGAEVCRRGRPVSQRTEERLTYAGVVALGILTLTLVAKDLPDMMLR